MDIVEYTYFKEIIHLLFIILVFIAFVGLVFSTEVWQKILFFLFEVLFGFMYWCDDKR